VSRFFVDLVRIELRCFVVDAKNRLLPWRRRRIRALVARSGQRLNVACGPQVLPNFVNLDLQAASATVIEMNCRVLPFEDRSILGIRAEHFVEHLDPRYEAPRFFDHCYRVLTAGGVLRVIVPDAERYLRAYCRDDLEGFVALGVPVPFPEDLPTRMDVVNHTFHQWHEHRWGYDFETLVQRLKASGFRRVDRMSYRRSLDAELAVDRDEHSLYSLYVDAVK
jgi:predicted SAM-dependent methyltransferase